MKDGNTEFENDKHGVDSERNYAYLWGVNTRGHGVEVGNRLVGRIAGRSAVLHTQDHV